MSVGVIMGNIAAVGLATVTIDPASVAAATTAEQTFTVPGLKAGDFVYVNKPTNTVGVGVVNARASAANTLALTFMNTTAGAVDPVSESYTVLWLRPESSQTGVVA